MRRDGLEQSPHCQVGGLEVGRDVPGEAEVGEAVDEGGLD